MCIRDRDYSDDSQSNQRILSDKLQFEMCIRDRYYIIHYTHIIIKGEYLILQHLFYNNMEVSKCRL